MTTKAMAINSKTHIDWDYVNRMTEVPRTYEIKTKDGRHFFKMYKPSEVEGVCKSKGWTWRLMGTLERKY